MMLANYIGAVALVVIGFYAMAMKRDIIKIVVGMGLVDYGLNLMIVSIGFNEGGTAPIYTFGELTSGMYFVDPIPQALTLTSIVIGACVTAMALALCVRIYKEYGTLDAREIRTARMTHDVYMHFPVLAIMVLFVGAFLVTLAGKREKLRNVIAGVAVLAALTLLALLIKPVMIGGETIVYWMGNWEPVSGYAIGIAIEVDALSLFFGLLVAIAVACSCFYSFRYIKQDDARGSYFTLYLMLAGGVMGIVLSGDLFNIYVMLEVMTFAAVGLTAFRTWNPTPARRLSSTSSSAP